jgi:dolichol-phosphate mannosyltransferase
MKKTLGPVVILATHNERDNLTRLVPEILRSDAGLHILVVDDASPNGTALVAQPNDVVDARQQGLFGHTTRQARSRPRLYPRLRGGCGLEPPAPRYLKQMLAMAPEVELVIGSRYVPGGGTLHCGLVRRLLWRLGSRYPRRVLGVEIADFASGFNSLHVEVQQGCIDSIRSAGYSFRVELKCRAAQADFANSEFSNCV